MQALHRFCLFVVSYSVLELYHRFFLIFLAFFIMDFSSTFTFFTDMGCSFLLLASYHWVFNVLWLILLLAFCVRFLDLDWHSDGLFRYIYEFGRKPRNRLVKRNNLLEDQDREVHYEDVVSDLMILRNLVKNERRRANRAFEELENERLAAAIAADEALAMILRLQSERSLVEIQTNHEQRVVELMQEYDQNVIESMRLAIQKCESERDLLHDRLKVYRERLSQFISEDELDQLDKSHENRDLLDLPTLEEVDDEEQEEDDDLNCSDS